MIQLEWKAFGNGNHLERLIKVIGGAQQLNSARWKLDEKEDSGWIL
jgi:hypothetical protein